MVGLARSDKALQHIRRQSSLPTSAERKGALMINRTKVHTQDALPLFLPALSMEPACQTQTPQETGSNPYLRRLGAFTPDLLGNAPFTLISLFCGGGGLDLGLGFGGFRTVVANDVAPTFVETVTSNIPGARPYPGDVMTLTASRLQEVAGTASVDLVAAGPPCQAFTILGRRGALNDPRGKLALKYFELVAEIQPRAFLFENVPGLLSVDDGAVWRRLLKFATESTGYHIHWIKLDAADFGIPQYRERVLIVGFRDDIPFKFPIVPTGPYAADLAVKGKLATPAAWALENIANLPNHSIRQHGDRVRTRYAAIPPGKRDKIDHTDRIHPDYPSGTVLVGSSEGGGRPHIHPFQDRVISVREGARLQSFPDWYTFHGTATAQYRQIGNAVPVLLAYEVGKKIAEALSR